MKEDTGGPGAGPSKGLEPTSLSTGKQSAWGPTVRGQTPRAREGGRASPHLSCGAWRAEARAVPGRPRTQPIWSSSPPRGGLSSQLVSAELITSCMDVCVWCHQAAGHWGSGESAGGWISGRLCKEVIFKLQERTPRARRPRGGAAGVRAAEEGCWRGEGWGGRGCKPGKVQRCRGSLLPARSLPEVPAWAGGPSSHVAISPPSFLSPLPAGVAAAARTAGPEDMPAASQPLKPSLRETKISVTIHHFRASGTWEVQSAN